MQDVTWQAAVKEQRAVVASHGEGLSLEALGDMGQLHSNIQEALRMFPPLIMVMRYVKQPFSVTTSAGRSHVIPKVL